ncbi:MAG: hypothetical protein HC888_00465 [Candidatus Competibacteraceae bacterium]|nr:hypothetical protein [Candidatus Competibacteraceae bacterium]
MDNFCESSSGLLLIANGIDRMLRWDGQSEMTEAGIDAPTTAPVITASLSGTITGTYTAYVRFVDADENYSNLSPISNEVTATNAFRINYASVPIPTSSRVKRRQILRNTAGQTTTYYVDIDTEDLSSTAFFSTNTDATLAVQQAQALLDSEGRTLANLYTPPPNHKPFIQQHINRIFAAGNQNYSEGSVKVSFGSPLITGIGTDWKSTFVGRFVYITNAPKVYEVSAVDVANQIITLSENYLGASDPYSDYSIRPARAEENILYYSEPNLPESWPAINGLSLPEDGDQVTGLMAMGSFLYILKRKRCYRMTAQQDPAEDGFIFLATNRGCVNNRCWVSIGNEAYILDEAGIYRFGGGDFEEVSSRIDHLFSGEDEFYRINWDASKFFHACHDHIMKTIRWFICLGGDYLPKNALCLNYETGRFWVESYSRHIGASFLGRIGSFTSTWREQSGEQMYLGTDAKKILAFRTNSLDGPEPSAGTTRGTATDASRWTLTDTQANFASSGLVGNPIAIVTGKGKFQVRVIRSVSNGVIRITKPWSVVPDETSVYQIGGIRYQYRTGRFAYANIEASTVGNSRMVFQPSLTAGDVSNIRIYQDFDADPEEFFTKMSSDKTYGVKYRKNDPNAEVDLHKTYGHVNVRSDRRRERSTDAPRFLTFEIFGISSPTPLKVRQIILDGVGSPRRGEDEE